jgi:hypothetical protein
MILTVVKDLRRIEAFPFNQLVARSIRARPTKTTLIGSL